MPDPVRLAKAELRELDSAFNEVPNGATVRVQFNPETLKVSFSNQLKTPEGSQGGTAAIQFVGTGTTKLSLQLWFDVTAPQVQQPEVKDVRKLTQKVAFYMLPGKKNPKAPPAVRFIWGTFVFDGVMESLEESLELFSPDGRPLRASVNVSLTQQRITFKFVEKGKVLEAKDIKQAKSGATVQAIASDAGKADEWQDIAAANGIENPRLLPPGTAIDLARRRRPR
jgi:hypothetical protein